MLIWGLVHDSILAEVKDEYIDIYCSKLKEITQKDRGLSIPNCPIGVDVEIGQSYGTVKPI
jgi:DNA polymerase I-like protein with 3'-5' exonuclease and polymerase domains